MKIMEYTKNNPLRCFFAFEGYNSQGLALNRLKDYNNEFDWVCVGRSEIEKNAIIAADALFPENKDKNYGDISKINWNKVPDFDLFTMSSPCTDFSQAGLQKGGAEGSGTRSSLLWECRKAIIAKKPKFIVFENVKALVSAKFLPYFNKWQLELESYGYTNFAQVLNSKDYGVPQNRERIFLVSILNCYKPYEFPKGFPLKKRLIDVLEKDVSETYYLSKKLTSCFKRRDILAKEKGNGFRFSPTDGNCVAKAVTTLAGNRMDDNFIQDINIVGDLNLPGRLESAGRVYSTDGISPTLNTCQGGGREPMILDKIIVDGKYGNYVSDKIVNPKGISPTFMDGKGKGVTINNKSNIRKLTEREVFRLMGLKDEEIDIIKATGMKKTNCYKLAGNSIVVDVLYHIFRKLLIDKETENQQLKLIF